MTTVDGPSHDRSVSTVPAAAAPAGPTAAPLHTVPSTVVSASHASRFEPDAFVAGAVGLVLLLIGLIASIRGGFSGSMSVPVIKVLGFTHTTTLGLIEVAIGLVLMVAAGMRSRAGELFGGLVLGVAGFVGVVQHRSFIKTLALQPSLAWWATIAGVVVVLCALLLPRFLRRSTVVEQR
jgi:hypothetical protein